MVHNNKTSRSKGALLSQLLAVTTMLSADMQRALARDGLTEARTHLLWTLDEIEQPTQRDLAARLQVSARNITALVDGLETTGFVVRTPHPRDRRATIVVPTAKGRAMLDKLQAAHAELAGQLFAAVPADDLAATSRTLDAIAARLAALIEPG